MKKTFTFCSLALILSMPYLSSCSSDSKEEILPPTCDTSGVKYSTTILSILSNHCYGCHSGTNPIAPFRLDSYAAVAVQAGNGKLWGAVSHSAGFSPMPKNAAKLGSCDLSKIKKWLDDGFPNN